MICLAPTRRRRGGRRPKPIDNPPLCRHCQKVIARRRYGYWQESPFDYMQRKFCNNACARAWNDRPEAVVASRPAGPRAASFDEYVLDHIERMSPKQPGELHNEIVNDWGTVTYRTLARSLARLRRARVIVQTGDGYVRAVEMRRRSAA